MRVKFSILPVQFSSMSIALFPFSKTMPKIFILSTISNEVTISSCMWCPIFINFVLWEFSLRPEKEENSSITSDAELMSFSSFKKRDVSSASCLHLILFSKSWSLGNSIPLMLLFRIFMAKISTANTKASGENGHLCLMPQFTLNGSESQPPWFILLNVFENKVLTHFVNCSPNLNNLNASIIRSLEIESKALQ